MTVEDEISDLKAMFDAFEEEIAAILRQATEFRNGGSEVKNNGAGTYSEFPNVWKRFSKIEKNSDNSTVR